MSKRQQRERAEARVGSNLLGKWTLDRLLDIGGMAAVFAATHRNGNQVAIKLLHPHVSKDKESRERFLREGYVANRVQHPGVVKVLDDDETDTGEVFIVMELLNGESLEARLDRKGLMTPVEALFVADQVLDVLSSAHAAGIIHRDIKPANIFLTANDGVKLLDFGLARLREQAFKGAMTKDGLVLGTVSYLAPEQAAAKTEFIDPRTDLWALGATIYKALSGHVPHEGGSKIDRVLAAMRKPAPSLATVLPGASKDLVALVDCSLAFEKDHRFPDAAAMQRAVAELFESLAGQPVPSQQRLSMPRPTFTNLHTMSATASGPDDESVAFELKPKARRSSPPPSSSNTISVEVEIDVDAGDVVILDTPLEELTGSMIEEVPEELTGSMIEEVPLSVEELSPSNVEAVPSSEPEELTMSMIEEAPPLTQRSKADEVIEELGASMLEELPDSK